MSTNNQINKQISNITNHLKFRIYLEFEINLFIRHLYLFVYFYSFPYGCC